MGKLIIDDLKIIYYLTNYIDNEQFKLVGIQEYKIIEFLPHYFNQSPSEWVVFYEKNAINVYSIRKCVEIVEINIETSFFCKHKSLNCIGEFLGVGTLIVFIAV